MSRAESLCVVVLGFAVAFGVFTVLFAAAPRWGGDTLLSDTPAQVPPIARLLVDKTTCQVGQDIVATYEYYNPSEESVTLYPPSQITLRIEQAGEKNSVGVVYCVSWAFTNRELAPRESFTIYRDVFTATKPGNMTITINGLMRVIAVSQPPP